MHASVACMITDYPSLELSTEATLWTCPYVITKVMSQRCHNIQQQTQVGAAPRASKAGSANDTIINQGEAPHDGPEYSCLGPQYETIDSSRRESQSQKNQKARSRLLSERYEYSETHCMAAADGGTATVENASYAEIPMNFKQEQYSTENANYSHLKH